MFILKYTISFVYSAEPGLLFQYHLAYLILHSFQFGLLLVIVYQAIVVRYPPENFSCLSFKHQDVLSLNLQAIFKFHVSNFSLL